MYAVRAKGLMFCSVLMVFCAGWMGGRISARKPTQLCLEDALALLGAAPDATLPAAIGAVRERSLRAVYALRSLDHEHARIALRIIAEAAKD